MQTAEAFPQPAGGCTGRDGADGTQRGKLIMKRLLFSIAAAVVFGAVLGSAALAQTPGAMGNLGPYPPVNPFLARPLAPNQSVRNMSRYVNEPPVQPMYQEPRWGSNGYRRATPRWTSPGEFSRFNNRYFNPYLPPPRTFERGPAMVNNPHYLPGNAGRGGPNPVTAVPRTNPYSARRSQHEFGGLANRQVEAGNSGARSFNRNPWFMSRHKSYPGMAGRGIYASGNHGLPHPKLSTSGHHWKHHPPAPDSSSTADKMPDAGDRQ